MNTHENSTHHTLLSIFVMIALLAFSYAAITFVHSYERNIQPSSFRSFDVSSEGRVIATPDIASFTFTVISEGDTDLSQMQSDNAQKINTLNTFLKENSIESEDIKTTEYSVYPRYTSCYAYQQPNGVCPPSEIVGYTVRQSTQVKIRDFDTIGDILSGIVSRGANSVSQISFEIDDETELMAQAREEAIRKAEEKAKQIADAGDFSVGQILSINEGFSYPYAKNTFARDLAYADEESMNIAPTIEAGSQEVVVTVTIKYEIK